MQNHAAGLETNAEEKGIYTFKRTNETTKKKCNSKTINLKSEHKEREWEKDRKTWTFNLVLSFAGETIQV